MANPFQKKNLLDQIPKTLKIPKPPKKIAGPIPVEAMESEIDSLREDDKRLLISKNYEVFLADAVLPEQGLHDGLGGIAYVNVGVGGVRAHQRR